jgi:hypothetical protein
MRNLADNVSYKMGTEAISHIAPKINDKGYKFALGIIKDDL